MAFEWLIHQYQYIKLKVLNQCPLIVLEWCCMISLMSAYFDDKKH